MVNELHAVSFVVQFFHVHQDDDDLDSIVSLAMNLTDLNQMMIQIEKSFEIK